MQEFLKLSQEDQKLAMEQTAARKGWVASSVEKDLCAAAPTSREPSFPRRRESHFDARHILLKWGSRLRGNDGSGAKTEVRGGWIQFC
jgi:hypothetical protein